MAADEAGAAKDRHQTLVVSQLHLSDPASILRPARSMPRKAVIIGLPRRCTGACRRGRRRN
jgi:hypothetical protein